MVMAERVRRESRAITVVIMGREAEQKTIQACYQAPVQTNPLVI
jgi:hypothetical protein